MMQDNGLVHVYTGNGKGKTTVALGLTLRALGHGFKVYIIQFMKGGNHLGEISISKKIPNLKVKQFGKKCPYSGEMKKGTIDCGNCRDCFITRKKEEEKIKEGLVEAEKAVTSGKYDLVILDEINNALSMKLADINQVLDLINKKNKSTELVLTGRGAPKKIIDYADYVTILQDIKHPFRKGLRVRRGIDY